MCYGWPSVLWGKVTKEGLEANHAKRHWGNMRKIREGMEADHKKRIVEAVEWDSTKILWHHT